MNQINTTGRTEVKTPPALEIKDVIPKKEIIEETQRQIERHCFVGFFVWLWLKKVKIEILKLFIKIYASFAL